MTLRRTAEALIRKRKARRAAAQTPETGAAMTPQDRLVQAARDGQFEAIVAAAQPAEPPKMVTPEEREAELRRTGQWPSEKSDSPSPVLRGRPGGGEQQDGRAASPLLDPPPSDGGGGPELTPNEQYIAEHCRWGPRRPSDHRERVPYGRCLTEYDPLTGEIIGDGYIHDEEDDDEW